MFVVPGTLARTHDRLARRAYSSLTTMTFGRGSGAFQFRDHLPTATRAERGPARGASPEVRLSLFEIRVYIGVENKLVL